MEIELIFCVCVCERERIKVGEFTKKIIGGDNINTGGVQGECR